MPHIKGTLLKITYTANQIKPDWWVSVCKVLVKIGLKSPLWNCYEHKVLFKAPKPEREYE